MKTTAPGRSGRSKPPKPLLEQLKHLSAREFEHLVYDLLVRRGFVNVSWRTPGADGGRDIEAEVNITDISGEMSVQTWYVECKRYKTAVDWPTVRDKIAFAENHKADYLLICTTGSLSSVCKDETKRRSARQERPVVRAWEGAALEHLIKHDHVLRSKYRLGLPLELPDGVTLPLLWHVSKAVQDAYGRHVLQLDPGLSIELSAALAELAVVLAEHDGSILQHHPTLANRDVYDWVDIKSGDLSSIDRYVLRALLTSVRFTTNSDRLSVVLKSDAIHQLIIAPVTSAPTQALVSLLNSICIAGSSEWRIESNELVIDLRN